VLTAQKVIAADDQVDALKEQIIRELLTYMLADPKAIERSLALILIACHLERIADHATNIAEDVIYVIQGRDVRHPTTPRSRRNRQAKRLLLFLAGGHWGQEPFPSINARPPNGPEKVPAASPFFPRNHQVRVSCLPLRDASSGRTARSVSAGASASSFGSIL
jgi:hypothetical protein